MIAHETGQRTTAGNLAESFDGRYSQEFEAAGVESLAAVYKMVKTRTYADLGSFYDEHDHHALRSLSLPLPYVLEEIQRP